MKNLFYLILIPFALISCSNDTSDTVPAPQADIRDQIVGTYTYVSTDFRYSNNTIDEYTGIIKIEKSTTSNTIVFFENGEVLATGVKLESASNGVVFDLEDRGQYFDGLTIEYKGVDIINLGGIKYNGVFKTPENEVNIAFDTIVNDTKEIKSTYVMTKV